MVAAVDVDVYTDFYVDVDVVFVFYVERKSGCRSRGV